MHTLVAPISGFISTRRIRRQPSVLFIERAPVACRRRRSLADTTNDVVARAPLPLLLRLVPGSRAAAFKRNGDYQCYSADATSSALH